jgi:hypothetical protein
MHNLDGADTSCTMIHLVPGVTLMLTDFLKFLTLVMDTSEFSWLLNLLGNFLTS